ncbi:MAG: hypothetical protein Q7J75_04695 [Rhodoferax sp.]|nr:hypothetical protein [Rhodoferax sp.]
MRIPRSPPVMREAVLILVLLAVAMPASASGCGDHLVTPARQQAQGDGYTVVFAPGTWPIPVGHHFNIELVVCAPPGITTPASVMVDADMPAHRHGMNYRTTVRALGHGKFVAEGLMLHMPGRWRFIFDVAGVKQTVRLTHEVQVE